MENGMLKLNCILIPGGLCYHHTGRLGHAGLALALAAVMSSGCTAQDRNLPAKSDSKADGKSAVAMGVVVSELDPAIWRIYHAKNGDYWFGS
jgi:hypothetical protein